MIKQGLASTHIRNIRQLMIEIFKCLKGLPHPIANEIFMLRNIPYLIGNPRDLDSQLPRTVYSGHETETCRGPELWQQLPAKIKKNKAP